MSTHPGFADYAENRETDAPIDLSAAIQVLDQAIEAWAFPGCAFGVLSEGRVVLEGALGRFTYERSAPPVERETRYDIASLTKVVATTAAAMLLFQRGVLELDALVGDLLPGFVIGRATEERARYVTLRHLLSHSSGLPGYVPLFHTATSPAELIRSCLRLPLQAEPGDRAQYSDPGFILLGKAIEQLTGEDLSVFVHREILAPLGMMHTGYSPSAALRPLVPPTEEDELFRQRRIQGEVQDEHAYVLRGVAGHAGLFSTVPDLLRFAASMLPKGSGLGGVSLFDPEVVEIFATRQAPAGSSRALGWDTPSEHSSSGRFFSRNSIGHLGFSGCSMWIDRDARIAVALLTNRTWPDRASQEIQAVRPKFHDAVREALASASKVV